MDLNRRDALDWASDHGVVPSGPVTVAKVVPWSTVLRIPTVDGDVWFKAGGGGVSYEAGLLRALHAYGTPHLLEPVAVDVTRGWVLLPDGGRSLRSVLDADPDLRHWERVLPKYAELQRSLEHRGLPGVPDQRPVVLPALLAQLREQLAVSPDLEAVVPRFQEWCDELTGSGIVPTLQHDDLHDANVFANDVFYDWGDASLGFPFSSLLVTLRSVARRWSLEPGAVELARLRDAYLEPWTDAHSRVELELLALLATRVGKVSRSASWLRALEGVEDPGEDAEAAPGWLEELLEPDVF